MLKISTLRKILYWLSSQVALLLALASAREFKSDDRFLSADPVRKEPARCGYCRASLNTEKGRILKIYFSANVEGWQVCAVYFIFSYVG